MIIGKNIDLREIEASDAEFVLQLRLDASLNKYISSVEDDVEKQREWIKKSKLKKDEIYFIVQNKLTNPVGTIRIYDMQEETFCWGSWVIIPGARRSASFESAFLLYDYAFNELDFKQTNFDIRKENKVVLNFHLRFGAVITGETDLDYLMSYTKERFLNKRDDYLKIIEDIFRKNIIQNKPLVSIALITYNSERFIANDLNSVLTQDYHNIEIIISDDASTDGTVKIIQQYVSQYPSKIRLLINEKNLGITNNSFRCISACRGKYVLWLAGDDELLPGIISKQVETMESDSNIAICYTDAVVFDVANQKKLYNLSDKTPTKSGGLKIALQNSIYYSPTSMFRRSLVPEENIFKDLKHGTDLAFLKELIIIGGLYARIQYLPEVLYKYQKHDTNITETQKEYRRDHIESIKILQKKYPQYAEDLNPAIYDFACVGFFRSILRARFLDAKYFFYHGFVASKGNIFKFCRALIWGVGFLIKK